MLRVVVAAIDVVHLLLAALVAGVFGVELAVTVVLAVLPQVVVELVLLLELVLVVFVVEACGIIITYELQAVLTASEKLIGPKNDGSDKINGMT